MDDQHDTAESFTELLNLLGHDAQYVTDPLVAVDAARAFRPSVAFLDISMPGLSGYQLAARLKDEFGPHNISMVAITAYCAPEDRQRSRKAGFDAHIVKPVDMPMLESILGTVGVE